MGVPDMEDHRHLHFPCQIQLVTKPQMLLHPVLLLFLVVIVHTDFANDNYTRCICICSQFMPVRSLFENGSGGMDTDYQKDSPGIFCTELQYFPAGLQTYTRLDEITDACIML